MGLLVGGVFDVEPGDLLVPHLFDWSFDGVDDYVNVPSTPLLSGLNNITVMAWIKPSKTTEGTIVSKHDNAYNKEWMLYINPLDYRYRFQVFDQGAGTFSEAVGSVAQSGAWVFLAGAYNGSAVTLYENGALRARTQSTVVVRPLSAPVRIGSRADNARFYGGVISSVIIYSRALSEDEIQQVYSVNTVPGSGLVLFLDATLYNGTHYIDISGNGNHGVPYNGVQRVPAEQRFVLHVKGRFSDGIPRLAVPGRCTYMFDCSWRENRGDSPVFVELQPGRRLVLVETLD